MAELSPPSAITVAEIVYRRLKDEMPLLVEEALKSKYSGWTDGGEAFDRGRLLGQTEGRAEDEAAIRDFQATVKDLREHVERANRAYLVVAQDRDHQRQALVQAEQRHAQEAAKARSLHRRLELIRTYLHPGCKGGGPQQIRDALDDAVDPWSILLPNEPF